MILPLVPAWGGEGTETTQAMLEPAAETTLSSEISARILEIPVEEGDSFKADDLLLRFDCAFPQAQLKKAHAESVAARKQLDVDLRMQRLDSVSELELAMSRAKVLRAEAEEEMAAIETRHCQVKAPFAGRLVKRHVDPFASVGKQDQLMDILASGPLKVRLYVPSAWSIWIRDGASFTVHVDQTGRQYPARVTALGARVDAASQTLSVRGEITGDFPELLAGMSGVAHFMLKSP